MSDLAVQFHLITDCFKEEEKIMKIKLPVGS